MKQMTREELDTHLEALGMKLGKHEVGYIICHSDNSPVDVYGNFLELNSLDIEIKPEFPPITPENLCKFYLKFKRWPEANFKNFCGKSKRGKLYMVRALDYMDNNLKMWDKCEIIDERWPEIAEGVENDHL